MLKVLYFSPNVSSFVKRDIDELRKNYAIDHFVFEMEKKYLIPYYFIKQLIFILMHHRQVKFYISRFAGYHSLLPSIFGKFLRIKHFIVLCGVDCNIMPSLGYGHGLKPFLRYINGLSMRLAYMLLPVSKNLISSSYTYAPDIPSKQGYLHIYKDIKTRNMIIHDGIDTSLFRFTDAERDDLAFVTISAGLENKTRRMIKGIDMFVRCAEEFPEYSFSVIGSVKPKDVPSMRNLHFIPYVKNEELPDLLSKFGFYMQLSMSEGFGNALLEGMACGCIPIVSDIGMMTEIVGDFGYVLDKKDVTRLRDIVEKAASEISIKDRKAISSHITDNYSILHRSEMLLELLRNEE